MPHRICASPVSWPGRARHLDRRSRHSAGGDREGDRSADRPADAVRAAACPSTSSPAVASGTYLHTAPQPGITEVQAGGATMGDGYYRALESPVEPALTPADHGHQPPRGGPHRHRRRPARHRPQPEGAVARGVEGVQAIRFSAEHGIMALDGPTGVAARRRPHRAGGQLHRPGGASPRIALRHP